MQAAETDNLNKNTMNYSQHIIILTELAVIESWHVLRDSWAQIQAAKSEQCDAEFLTVSLIKSFALNM